MKKFLLTLVVLGLSSVALMGCRVEGEVDDDMSTNVTSPR
jgi:hypothetical protein